MRIFVTGASGWIASATIPELLAAGHEVVGLARSDAAAATVEARGATVLRGSLADLDVLRTGAGEAEGVVHLGFIHDFSAHEDAVAVDQRAIAAMTDVLGGTGKPLVIASGVLGRSLGRPMVETDLPDPATAPSPRAATEVEVLGLGRQGVRSAVVRFAPTVHGAGDHGFMAARVGIAREKGVAAYIGDGSGHWPAVHRLDAGALVRIAVEQAPAGTVLHAIAEQGVASIEIAEVIGRKLGIPTQSIAPDDAMEHFGWLGRFLAVDNTASSEQTQQRFGWTPSQPTLLEDLESGAYTD